MGVSKDSTRSAEDIQSTPLPGETLAMFYARSRASTSTGLLTLYTMYSAISFFRRILVTESNWKQ